PPGVVGHEDRGGHGHDDGHALPGVHAHASLPGSKMDSIGWPNSRAILNASGRLGSYLPVSIALTVWRDTSSRSARSACDQPCAPRSSRTWLFMVSITPGNEQLGDAERAEQAWQHPDRDGIRRHFPADARTQQQAK